MTINETNETATITDKKMKIYGSTTSPFVRKVRIVAMEKKLDWEFVLDSNQMPDYQAARLNPLGKVPVLQLDEHIVVFDSPVIAEYLDNLTPNKKLIPAPSREKMVVKRWEALCDGVCEAAIAVVMEGRRSQEKQDANVISHQLTKVTQGIKFMAGELSTHEWCFGNSITLADIALICALDYVALRLPYINWKGEYPNLAAFHQRMWTLPSVMETTPFA